MRARTSVMLPSFSWIWSKCNCLFLSPPPSSTQVSLKLCQQWKHYPPSVICSFLLLISDYVSFIHLRDKTSHPCCETHPVQSWNTSCVTVHPTLWWVIVMLLAAEWSQMCYFLQFHHCHSLLFCEGRCDWQSPNFCVYIGCICIWVKCYQQLPFPTSFL